MISQGQKWRKYETLDAAGILHEEFQALRVSRDAEVSGLTMAMRMGMGVGKFHAPIHTRTRYANVYKAAGNISPVFYGAGALRRGAAAFSLFYCMYIPTTACWVNARSPYPANVCVLRISVYTRI